MPLELLAYKDCIQPFLIHHSLIRGKMVRLVDVVDTILSRHTYPDVVSHLLAELLVVAAMLSANMKGKGILTLQLKGEGAVRFIVVDATAEGTLRGYADLHENAEEMLAGLTAGHASLTDIMGKGYVAITLDQGGAPYQGIVELAGTSLTDTIHHYFTASDQSELWLTIKVGKTADTKQWRAGGMMLQRVAAEGGSPATATEEASYTSSPESQYEKWQHACLYGDTLHERELLDQYLPPQQLLYRLFNEDGVWIYDPTALHADCRCSREKIITTLRSFSDDDKADMSIDGVITVTCQFCNKDEVFVTAEL
jgi:molecular chaperone Hsp33